MQYRARFRGTPRSVRTARAAIVGYSRTCGFPERDLDDIACACGEALANALEHGNQFGGFITVVCSFEAATLLVEIRDQGPGFTRPAPVDPEDRIGATRGFGISIMHRLMDEVHFSYAGKHAVRLMKRLPPSQSIPSHSDCQVKQREAKVFDLQKRRLPREPRGSSSSLHRQGLEPRTN